jgi:hypothetical protein
MVLAYCLFVPFPVFDFGNVAGSILFLFSGFASSREIHSVGYHRLGLLDWSRRTLADG